MNGLQGKLEAGRQGDRDDEDLHDCGGDAGVDRDARVMPRWAAEGRRATKRSRRAEEEDRREGLQGRARKNTRAQGKVRSVGRRAGRPTPPRNRSKFARPIASSPRGSACEARMRKLAGLFALTLFASAPALGWEHWGGDRRRDAVFTARRRSRRPMSAISCAPGSFAPAISIARPPAVMARTKFEATPLFVEDSLIFCSPFNEVIALDPGTGAQKWRYDPKISTSQRPANRYVCRGVAYWVDDQAARKCGLPRPDFHGHQRCPRHRARRQDRHSLRRFRRATARSSSISAGRWNGRANSRSRPAPVVSRGVVIVGSVDRGQPQRRCAARNGARLRCAHRAVRAGTGIRWCTTA